MKRIASRDNPLYKELRRLAQEPAFGRRQGWALLEGLHPCQEYLQRVGAPRWAIFDTDRLGASAELLALWEGVSPAQQVMLDGGILAGLSDIGAAQGVAFVIEPPKPTLPERLVGLCVLLDRVQDPGNVGSILRTCAAAGVATVLLSEQTASAWGTKTLRAGQGAHFALAIYEGVDLIAAVARLDVPLLTTALEDADSLYGPPLPAACAWVFGHEGGGVQPALLAAANRRVRIPQSDGVESLNVAAAAAVCLFEQRRQGLVAQG
jgi:TrmH family RNA methyltransferase